MALKGSTFSVRGWPRTWPAGIAAEGPPSAGGTPLPGQAGGGWSQAAINAAGRLPGPLPGRVRPKMRPSSRAGWQTPSASADHCDAADAVPLIAAISRGLSRPEQSAGSRQPKLGVQLTAAAQALVGCAASRGGWQRLHDRLRHRCGRSTALTGLRTGCAVRQPCKGQARAPDGSCGNQAPHRGLRPEPVAQPGALGRLLPPLGAPWTRAAAD